MAARAQLLASTVPGHLHLPVKRFPSLFAAAIASTPPSLPAFATAQKPPPITVPPQAPTEASTPDADAVEMTKYLDAMLEAKEGNQSLYDDEATKKAVLSLLEPSSEGHREEGKDEEGGHFSAPRSGSSVHEALKQRLFRLGVEAKAQDAMVSPLHKLRRRSRAVGGRKEGPSAAFPPSFAHNNHDGTATPTPPAGRHRRAVSVNIRPSKLAMTPPPAALNAPFVPAAPEETPTAAAALPDAATGAGGGSLEAEPVKPNSNGLQSNAEEELPPLEVQVPHRFNVTSLHCPMVLSPCLSSLVLVLPSTDPRQFNPNHSPGSLRHQCPFWRRPVGASHVGCAA